MAEIRTVTTLTYKREEIERTIIGYERKLEQARADLSHINAAIAIFAVNQSDFDLRAYVDLHRIWKRGDLMLACKRFLAAQGPLSTKELALLAMKDKGLDATDRILAKKVAHLIIQAARKQYERGTLLDAGKRHTARIWALPPQSQ